MPHFHHVVICNKHESVLSWISGGQNISDITVCLGQNLFMIVTFQSKMKIKINVKLGARRTTFNMGSLVANGKY